MGKRKSTGKRQRFNVFKRDRFTCQYCGRTPPTVVLVLDHILPVAAGGETIDHNLATSCEECNQGKAAGLLTDVPQAINEQLAAQVERQEQLREYNRFLLALRKEQDDTARQIGTYWCDRTKPPAEHGKWTFGPERLTSVRRFLDRLPVSDIFDSVDIAFSRRPLNRKGDDDDTFKYFCGVCWNKIKKREEPAK